MPSIKVGILSPSESLAGSLLLPPPPPTIMKPFAFIHPLGISLFGLLLSLGAAPRASAQGTSALTNSEESYVKQLYQNVLSSQRLATLAVNDGKKPEVRQLAVGVSDALKAAAADLTVLARKKSIILTDDQIGRPEGAVEKLSNAGVDEFDRTYITMLLSGLPQILADMERALGSTADTDFKDFLVRFIPLLKGRIAAVEAVKARL